MESNDSPEIPDKGRHQSSPASLRGTEGMHVKLLQSLDVAEVQCPGPGPVEKRCEDNGTVGLQLCGESDVVLGEHPSAKTSKGLACFVILDVISLSRNPSLEKMLPRYLKLSTFFS